MSHIVKDANGTNQTFKSTTDTGELVPHVRVDNFPTDGAKEAKQDSAITELTAIKNKIIATPATEAKQDTGNTTLANILAKLIAAPATQANQDTIIAALTTLISQTDGVEGTLNSILSKIIVAPATEAKQDSAITELTAIKNKIIAAPATEATLASLLAKIIAAPSTEAKQDTIITAIGNLLTDTQLRATPLSVNFPSGLEVAGPTAQSAINVDLLTGNVNGWYDARAFQSGTVQIIASAGISAGQIFFEQTNDNTSSTGIPLLATEVNVTNANPQNAAFAIAASANRMFRFGINGAYIRVRISTAFVGGTVRAIGFFSDFPESSPIVNVQQATAANLNTTVSGTVTANIGTGSLAAGTNAIGDVGLQVRANATGAASKYHLVSGATTNANNVKASAGRLLGWRIANTNAAFRYVKLHNTAGTPTAGAAVVETIAVPPNSVAVGNIPQGSGFATGIAITTVTGAADSDATAVGANDLIIDLYFA